MRAVPLRKHTVLAVGLLAAALLVTSAGCEPAGPPDVAAPAPPAVVRESVEHFQGEAGPLVAVPEDFPADLPIYPGARPTAHVASAQHGRLLMFSSEDDPETVLEQIRAAWEHEGWAFAHETDLEGEQLIAFTKQGRRASVAVAATRDGSRITLATTPGG